MKTAWLETREIYDGQQMQPLFAYLRWKVLGDSIVAWRGPCKIPWEHMLDGEDLVAQARIEGSDMVHFIVEKFECELYAGVGLQRLLASLVIDVLHAMTARHDLRREGDDIYRGDHKLSISIAARSVMSVMIHFAVNVSNQGTPVATLSLEDLGVDPIALARAVMTAFAREAEGMVAATRKVRPIG